MPVMLENVPEVNAVVVSLPPFVSLEWSCVAFVKSAIVGVVNVLLVKGWIPPKVATVVLSILIVYSVLVSVTVIPVSHTPLRLSKPGEINSPFDIVSLITQSGATIVGEANEPHSLILL